MGFGINFLKNLKQPSIKWLATAFIIGAAIVPVLSMLGFNLNAFLPTISALIVGAVLVIDSGVNSLSMPKGAKGIINLGVFLIGAALVTTTILTLIGYAVPGFIAWAAGFSAVGLVAALLI